MKKKSPSSAGGSAPHAPGNALEVRTRALGGGALGYVARIPALKLKASCTAGEHFAVHAVAIKAFKVTAAGPSYEAKKKCEGVWEIKKTEVSA
ncbi:MAG: hypothetical protein M0Z75_03840 [Nitrospiraceae bacterium]|nr:hypothetical protein [Nitrospiraceae bacterium]